MGVPEPHAGTWLTIPFASEGLPKYMLQVLGPGTSGISVARLPLSCPKLGRRRVVLPFDRRHSAQEFLK
jgi:hypothetical protein